MKNLIKKLVKDFKNIHSEDDKPIKMAIMELDPKYKSINNFGLENVNKELEPYGLIVVKISNQPKDLNLFSLQEISA